MCATIQSNYETATAIAALFLPLRYQAMLQGLCGGSEGEMYLFEIDKLVSLSQFVSYISI